MATVKERKIYSVDEFRGLDKENKLLKVAPFRAADGYNFVIDSKTLKTRPAFSFASEIPFTLDSGDYVIDWYVFQDTTLYITKKHFYIYNGTTTYNERSTNILVTTSNIVNINFEGLRPLFQEEKEALFIFGLNDIYVFAVLRDNGGNVYKYVLYELNRKPLSPAIDAAYSSAYEDLPKAYEPTIFIGDKRADDINMLSPVREYKMFASSAESTQGGRRAYYMPTDYDPTKHKDLLSTHGFDASITFYKDRFPELNNLYPLFLGVLGEDFDLIADYGSTVLNQPAYTIEQTFYPKATFEYTGTSEDLVLSPVSEIYEVDRDWFFTSSIAGLTEEEAEVSKDTFLFLLNYIKENKVALEGVNTVLEFQVLMSFMANFRDATTNNITETIRMRKYVPVYVQIKGLDIDTTTFSNELVYPSNTTNVISTDPTYPAYPTVSGIFDLTHELTTKKVESLENVQPYFLRDAKNYLNANKQTLQDDDLVQIKQRYFAQSQLYVAPQVNVNPTVGSWIFNMVTTYTATPTTFNHATKDAYRYKAVCDPSDTLCKLVTDAYPTYPAYPSTFVGEPNNANVIELSEAPEKKTDFSINDFEDSVLTYWNTNKATLSPGKHLLLRKKYYEELTETVPATAIVETNRTLWKTIKDVTIENTLAQYSDLVSGIDPSSPTYPDYPSTGSEVFNRTIVVSPTPEEIIGFNNDSFLNKFNTYINANKASWLDNERIKLMAQLYETYTETNPASAIITNESNWGMPYEITAGSGAMYSSSTSKVYEDNYLSTPYPSYPVVSGSLVSLTGSPESILDITNDSDIQSEALAYFEANKNYFYDGQLLRFQKQYYQTGSESQSIWADISPYQQEWYVGSQKTAVKEANAEITAINWNGAWTAFYAEHPSIPTQQGREMNLPNPVVGSFGENINLESATFRTAIENAVLADLPYSQSLEEMHGEMMVFVQVDTRWQDTYGTFYHKGYVMVIPFTFDRRTTKNFQLRRSKVYKLTVSRKIALTNVTYNNGSTFPAFPSGYTPAIDLGIINVAESGLVNAVNGLNFSAYYSALASGITSGINNLSGSSGYAYASVRFQAASSGGGYIGTSIIVYFHYTKSTSATKHKRQSAIYTFTLQTDTAPYIEEIAYANRTNPLMFPDFPTAPTDYANIDIGFVDYDVVDLKTFYTDQAFLNILKTKILTYVSSIQTDTSGRRYAKVYVRSNTNPAQGTSAYIPFDFTKSGTQTFSYRQVFQKSLIVGQTMDEDTTITWDSAGTFQNYPFFDNPGNLLSVADAGILSQSGQYFVFDETLQLNIRNKILEQIETLFGNPAEAKEGFCKVRLQTVYDAVNYKGISFIVPFSYAKKRDEIREDRISLVYTSKVDKVQEITNAHYHFFYDETEKRFELKLKDYFYDYNNEPSINVRIVFENNPDYYVIAKNRFGTTFGSENRMFLAGHPDYPNIDRYNVSNDLLSVNVKNQSYELAYFPSKNYRVLGSKGAINGYATATDSILYITKSEYPNDAKLFIRERIMDENGVVGYRESKTSANKTPLNERCIVRFNNDILMLTKDGLYGIELSSNVLTDERLVKIRSGLINEDIKYKVSNYDKQNIFIMENNMQMYMFVGNDVYMADSRYIFKDENSMIGDITYEILHWKVPVTFRTGRFIGDEPKFLNSFGKYIYHFSDTQNYDDNLSKAPSSINMVSGTNFLNITYHNAFVAGPSLSSAIADPLNHTLTLNNGYKVVARSSVSEYSTNGAGVVTILNPTSFRSVNNGDTLYFKHATNAAFYPFQVSEMSADRTTFKFDNLVSGDRTVIYQSIAGVPLRISTIITTKDELNTFIRLTPYTPSSVIYLGQYSYESAETFAARVASALIANEQYVFVDSNMKDVILNKVERINMLWVSGITDFGNRMMEKTMFRLHLYATKQSMENVISFGYKTMRRLNPESESGIKVTSANVSNPSRFDEFNFNVFGFSTFSETGFTMPMKENNFLYIQFVIKGVGQIELNSFEIIYKNNRMLKTVS